MFTGASEIKIRELKIAPQISRVREKSRIIDIYIPMYIARCASVAVYALVIFAVEMKTKRARASRERNSSAVVVQSDMAFRAISVEEIARRFL